MLEIATPREKRPWFAMKEIVGFFLFKQRICDVESLGMTHHIISCETNYLSVLLNEVINQIDDLKQ